MIYRLIGFGTDEYRQELDLRNRILRLPIGLNLFDEDLGSDAVDIHLGAFDKGILVGCLVLTSLDGDTLKMRQVAVDDIYQGQGIGSMMVSASEEYAIENGYTSITMNARTVSSGFYSKLGYNSEGDEFLEVGVPHVVMTKILNRDKEPG